MTEEQARERDEAKRDEAFRNCPSEVSEHELDRDARALHHGLAHQHLWVGNDSVLVSGSFLRHLAHLLSSLYAGLDKRR